MEEGNPLPEFSFRNPCTRGNCNLMTHDQLGSQNVESFSLRVRKMVFGMHFNSKFLLDEYMGQVQSSID
jgi:hypothetical protein